MAESSERFSAFMLRKSGDVPDGVPAPETVSIRAVQPFSAFNPAHITRVGELLFELNEAMAGALSLTAGVDAILAVAESAARTDGLELAQHALAIFATHAGKTNPGIPRLPVPPLAFLTAPPLALEALVPHDAVGEARMHWFREDLFLNEHHRHWHIVYPTVGAFDNGALRLKSRQGEIFVYMHQQMLARYDTERIAAGLNKVEPLNDFRGSLGEGYDPNVRGPANIGYLARPDNATLNTESAEDLEERRGVFRNVLATNQVQGQPVTLTPNLVGSLLESNHALFGPTTTTQQELNQESEFLRNGFQLHNFGHGAIASTPFAGNRVMNNPHTSLQDPVFWRWHRMIDNLAEEFAVTLPPHSFGDDDRIVIRPGNAGEASPDIVAIGETRLRAEGIDLDAADRDQAIADYVESKLGVDRWNEAIDDADISHELRTGPLQQHFVYQRETFDPDTGDFTGTREVNFMREHLISERFVSVVRVQNATSDLIEATLRVFLCADTFLDLNGVQPDPGKRAEEHRFWIELERSPVTLEPGQNVFHRVSDQASVVRKLNGRGPWPTSAFTAEDFGDMNSGTDTEDDYCDCGWPLNLQLPRGTPDGMGFHIMAMVSEGVPTSPDGPCGSRVFCGAGFDDYPEVRERNLGYPFDRPTSNGTLAMINSAPNMAVRRLRIRHDETLASEFGLL